MTTAPAERRGSSLETWRLLWGSAIVAWLPMVAIFVALLGLAVAFTLPPAKPITFGPCAAVIVIWFAVTTIAFERSMGQQLAFMAIVPQPVDTRRLVLVPMYAVAFVVAFVTAAVARLPTATALVLVGTAWWTTASVRWLRKLPSLLELPVLLAAFAGALLAHRFGGWGAAAAMLSGIVAFGFQPRVVIAASTRGPSIAPRTEPIALVERDAVSRPAGRAAWLKSAVRFLIIGTASMRGFFIFMRVFAAVFTLVQIIPGMALFPWVIAQNGLFQLHARETVEFIRPRPFSLGQRLVGGLLIPLLLSLVVPVLVTAVVDLDSINSGSVFRRLLRNGAHHAPTLGYFREILGATFLPEQWPAGGLTEDMWLRIRPLLWLDLLRMSSLIGAFLFSAAAAQAKARAGTVGFALQMFTLVVVMRLGLRGVFDRLPVPPLWFAALLAALAVVNWTWSVRAADRTEAATGTSTSG